MTEKSTCDFCGNEFDIADLVWGQVDEDPQGNAINAKSCHNCLEAPTKTDEAYEEAHYDDYDNTKWTCSYCGGSYGGGYCARSPDGNHWYEGDE